jgi:peroxiredoxin
MRDVRSRASKLHLGRRLTARTSTRRGIEPSGSEALLGRMLPRGKLPARSEPSIELRAYARSCSLILCVYSGIAKWEGKVELNGARAHTWHERELELVPLGYDVIALSAQSLEEQHAWIKSERLICAVLSDVELRLAATLRLPTIELDGARVYDDLTLVAQQGRVTQVFYPLCDLANDAQIVTSWLGDVHGV